MEVQGNAERVEGPGNKFLKKNDLRGRFGVRSIISGNFFLPLNPAYKEFKRTAFVLLNPLHVYSNHIHSDLMDKLFEQFLGFQWDKGNINKNLISHNVENWECEQIYFNKPLIILDDPRHSESEKRWAALGKTDSGRFLVIVFTRRSYLVRVISARDMNKNERRYYDEKG